MPLRAGTRNRWAVPVRRPFGLGPIPSQQPIDASSPLVVRQAAALGVGAFLVIVAGAFATAVLVDPGPTVGSGNGFVDRWFFGILIVPVLWGVDRFLLRPRVRADVHGVAFHNPVETIDAPWPAVLGAGFDGRLQLVLADGERVHSILFGPVLSSPLTKRIRVDQLIEALNAEAIRRGTRRPDPATYSAESLVASLDAPAEVSTGPGAARRRSPGLVNLAAYALAWTLACGIAAAVA